ncbi:MULTISPECIES: hypothetical protein [unclassified Pseudomonas]|uniref:hypothetical protein n=1 Tax=unclassified Pseudomonas TaxID=196821 RepID=UPI001AEAAFCD|nr:MULTISPECIES: hypothetical protein [unclassified Pseudomonas]MBP2273759.1 hypothetical protein [Pseudomonas sp. BP6]MBP2287270.1 hypothetical protein [Pseudomonas sp. BP7]HDS1696332.1 hypothetical protein [Pseudomonas putida]HDS1703377.1 hypothetical protein [Pseudomonas putida]
MELKTYIATDKNGDALPGALCYVYQRGTENIAPSLQKANGVSLTNPFPANELGYIQFAAPNGLYDLRVVKGARDYRIPVQLNDVDEGIAAANTAANRAEAARDVALAEANSVDSIEEGMLVTPVGGTFQVLSPDNGDYLVTYENVAGVAVEVRRYPTADAIDALRRLVKPSDTPNTHLEVHDAEDAQMVNITDDTLEIPGFIISSKDGATWIEDAEGGQILYADGNRILLGGLEIEPNDSPGILVVDAEDAILQDLCEVAPHQTEVATTSPLDGGLLFAPVIATSALADALIYPQNLLIRRELGPDIVATVSSTTTALAATGSPLALNAQTYGPGAVLNVRARSNANDRRFMALSLKHVPVQSPAVPVRILFIGDSIGNRQGGYLLKQFLTALGIDATFIGTLEGSAEPANANATNGEWGECREGWETGDFTYSITDRVSVVAPGGEDDYRNLSKTARWPINPFLRAATSSDSAEIVRNGYVFDPAFYLSRFGLSAPDIVIQALGTNNVRDRTDASIYANVYADDLIINGQLRKAFPSAKIIRTLPGTAYNDERNTLWTNRYVPLIRAIQQCAKDRADPKTIIAPLWAMGNPDAAYSYSSTGAANDGFIYGDWTDAIHPAGASRVALYQAMAPFVAAAALNLI